MVRKLSRRRRESEEDAARVAVSAGGKYLWFGDAQGVLPSDKIVGDFQDNDGYIFGVKLSYQDTK